MLAPQHRNDGVAIELRIERIAGQMRDGHRHVGAVDDDHVGEHPPAERALVDEAHRGAVVEQRRDAQVVLVRYLTQQHLPAHAEVHNQRRAVTEREPQILTAAARARDAIVEQSGSQIARAGLVAAHRSWVVHPHRRDGLARDVSR